MGEETPLLQPVFKVGIPSALELAIQRADPLVMIAEVECVMLNGGHQQVSDMIRVCHNCFKKLDGK